MTYLGIDLGTSGLRALLVDGDGTPIGSSERHYGVSHPRPGWSEQEPADWISALDGAVGELRGSFPQFAALRGIGVAGHMHGATLLDATGALLRPCILWNDTRAGTQAARLDRIERVRALSGNIVFPGFTAPKLSWIRKHEPDIFRRTAKVLLPTAFLNHYLTGDFVADMSDSSGTAWLDVGGREWSDFLLEAGYMRRDQMPRLVEGATEAGRLRPDLMRKWGLRNPVSVAGGAGDNAAAACGIGALNEAQGFVSLGTSGVLLGACDGYRPAPETAVHTFCHAVPGRWYQMGVMLSATDSLNWLARVAGQTPARLTGALGDRILPPGRVRFLPYLSGERTPHNDADIRGSFTGLSVDTSCDDLVRAVLEGVCFGLRDSLDALSTAGTRFDRLFAIGGGTASRYWVGLLASVLGIPLALPRGGEFGAATGAARLAVAAVTGASVDSIMIAPPVGVTIDPDPAIGSAVAEAHAAYRATYPALKSIR